MDTQLSIGIVGHINRLTMVEELAGKVGAEYLSVDDGTLGCEQNHRKLWSRLTQSDDEWLIVLEDDAQPVDDFRTQVTQALTHSPTDIVSLYLGRRRPPQHQRAIRSAIDQAQTVDANWILSTHLLHAVGYAIRTHLMPSLAAYRSTKPIDQAITAWAQHNNHQIAYTWPSLADHKDDGTLVKHRDGAARTPGRVAWHTGIRRHWNQTTVIM